MLYAACFESQMPVRTCPPRALDSVVWTDENGTTGGRRLQGCLYKQVFPFIVKSICQPPAVCASAEPHHKLAAYIPVNTMGHHLFLTPQFGVAGHGRSRT